MSAVDNPGYRRIWQCVAAIPPGRVAAYGQIADLAGMPGRARLVGRALRAAPDDLDLPWHRVLLSNGRIALAAGGEASREQLRRLRAEGLNVVRRRVDMRRCRWRPTLDEIVWGPLAHDPAGTGNSGDDAPEYRNED